MSLLCRIMEFDYLGNWEHNLSPAFRMLFFDYVDDMVILPSDNLLAKSLRSSFYVDDKVIPHSDTLLAESPRSYFPIYIGKIKATPLILAYISQYVALKS